jgi:2-keto-4-pentenoate hydratase/2-oxohepta-3-ene-1,7-dioic acid hydratase in catechol pathway
MYKLATYRSPHGARTGLIVDESLFDLADATGRPADADMLAVLRDWDAARGRIAEAVRSVKSGGRPLRGVTLLAPVPAPGAIFCAGANFTDHMLEMAQVQGIAPEPDPHSLGLSPFHFLKAQQCLAAPDATVPLPAYSKMVDWEAELTAVIGRPARDVPLDRALDYVAGYTIANDLSARDFTKRPHVADTPTPRRSSSTG